MLQPTSKNIPDFLKNEKLHLILFSGKGGVGKTTMAATTALFLAGSSRKHKKILIISTDPAHSLSDSFGIQIGDRVTPIQWAGGRGQGAGAGDQLPVTNLYAHELNAGRLLDHFKEKNQHILQKLAERGTYFDRDDIADFLDLSLPGMDEVMAIMEMARLLKENEFDTLVVDTAPTGHTIRMLDLPGKMKTWIDVMDLMQHKHRYMFRHFSGKRYMKDECDLFLERLSSDITRVRKMLSNPDTTRFVPVLIPELMSIYETKRMIASLREIHVPIGEMIVNRVAESDGCPFCTARVENQKPAFGVMDEAFPSYGRIQMPLFPHEINGLEALKKTADYFSGLSTPEIYDKPEKFTPESTGCIDFNPDLDLFLFSGKGGVGKTTLASAASLNMAQRHPDKKILLFSTDPAHSLSDAFDIPIGNRITPIEGAGNNLFALEINPDILWSRFKETFKQDMADLFDHFLGGKADIRFDRRVMTEMLEMAPPGLDEIMALDKMMDLRKENRFDMFVLDTSPTGHLLRFLELPHLVRQWLKAFFRLLIKYKGVVRLAGAAEKALSLSKNVRKIQETLVNSEKTRFISVTIAERMGFLELDRLMKVLEKANLPCEHIIVNMVLPRTDCGFCAHKHMEQQSCLQEIHTRFHSQTVVRAPLFPHPVRGTIHLKEISDLVFRGK